MKKISKLVLKRIDVSMKKNHTLETNRLKYILGGSELAHSPSCSDGYCECTCIDGGGGFCACCEDVHKEIAGKCPGCGCANCVKIRD